MHALLQRTALGPQCLELCAQRIAAGAQLADERGGFGRDCRVEESIGVNLGEISG